jgi:hypothetical protein
MQKQLKDQEPKDEDDWGQPRSPNTLENRKKAIKAQIILGIVAFTIILMPGVLYWLKFK